MLSILQRLFKARAQNALMAAVLISQQGPHLFDRIVDAKLKNWRPLPDHSSAADAPNLLTRSDLEGALQSRRFNPVDSLVITQMLKYLERLGHQLRDEHGGDELGYGANRAEICSFATRVLVEQRLLQVAPSAEEYGEVGLFV